MDGVLDGVAEDEALVVVVEDEALVVVAGVVVIAVLELVDVEVEVVEFTKWKASVLELDSALQKLMKGANSGSIYGCSEALVVSPLLIMQFVHNMKSSSNAEPEPQSAVVRPTDSASM